MLRRPLLRKLLLKLYRVLLRRMTVAQFLKTEAGGRYPEVSRDPSCRALGEKTLAAMADGVRCAGFENDFVVFTNEDVIGPDGSMHIPTLIIHDVMDPIAPEDHVAWLVAKCRQCKTVPVRAAGHLIWVGPGADDMHRARVRFLREPERRTAEPIAAAVRGRT